MSTYIIDKRFTTTVERTDRVLEIAEAFGLGLDNKEFVVFDREELEVRPGDVVYITGESGAGKSTLLRELMRLMREEGLSVMDIEQAPLDDTKPLIDQIGTTMQQGLEILSLVGLNDANQYIRKPNELSDGQRYRFRLAKLIESKQQVWFADEFLAVLDRTTAVVIASNLQKIARRVGATLVVATTHGDMVKDLAPNLYVEKLYRERVKKVYAPEGFQTP